jgi:hypothetical protein
MTMRKTMRSHPARYRAAAGFLKQESGSVTIFAVVGFALCIVIIGLVFDIGRVMGAHTQMNSYADRIAVAAAQELDGRDGALTRAVERAVSGLSAVGTGDRLSLSGNQDIRVESLTFLAELGAPPDGNFSARSPWPGDVVTATWDKSKGGNYTPDPHDGYDLGSAARDTRYVLVQTESSREGFLLFQMMSFLGAPRLSFVDMAPQAVAGFERDICNSPPVMMCSVNELPELGGVGAAFSMNLLRERQVKARIRTDDGPLGPGDIRMMLAKDPDAGFTDAETRSWMGSRRPNSYCSGMRISLGANPNPNAVREGLNTRFDMFDPNMMDFRNDSNYRAAANVQKGRASTAGNCSNTKSSNSTPLPRDNCFMPQRSAGQDIRHGVSASDFDPSECLSYAGRRILGNGEWQLDEYWQRNQVENPENEDSSHDPHATPSTFDDKSRYEIYRYEIDGDEDAYPPHSSEEQGAPTCHSGSPVDDPVNDRRVIPVAIVNCLEHAVEGQQTNIPVEAYARVFLTEPVGDADWWPTGQSSDRDVFLEILGRVDDDLPGTVLREYPVIVR